MARRIEHIEADALDRDALALGDPHGDNVSVRLLAHDRDAVGAVAQCAEARDVIGVQVRIDGFDQPDIEFAQQLEVTLDLFQHRIDDQRLAAAPAGEQICVGAGHRIVELSKYHAHLHRHYIRPAAARQNRSIRVNRASGNGALLGGGRDGSPRPAHLAWPSTKARQSAAGYVQTAAAETKP